MARKLNSNIKVRDCVKKANRQKVFKHFWGMFIFCIGTILLFISIKWLAGYFINHPNFQIKKFVIENNSLVPTATILQHGQLTNGMNIYITSIDNIKYRLEQYPDISNVEVEKVHPDTLKIKVTEREPLAVVVSKNGKLKIPIDKEGVMLTQNLVKYCKGLPQIMGACLTNRQVGHVISDPLVPIAIRYLNEIQLMPSHDFLTIKAMKIQKPKGIIFKSATIDYIVMGKSYNNNRVDRLLKILKKARQHRINVKEIDMRFNNVPVISKQL